MFPRWEISLRLKLEGKEELSELLLHYTSMLEYVKFIYFSRKRCLLASSYARGMVQLPELALPSGSQLLAKLA